MATKSTQKKTGQTTKEKAPDSAQPKDRQAPIDITGGREPVDVKLVGETYTMMPPKGIISLKFAKEAKKSQEDPEKLIESLETWIGMAFDDETAEAIKGRLYDNDDHLDITHIVQLIQKTTELSTGNPTT